MSTWLGGDDAMWKYYFNCDGPVVIEAGNINEAKQLCEEEYGCSPCEYLGCAPPGLCDGETSGFEPSVEFLQKAKARASLRPKP